MFRSLFKGLAILASGRGLGCWVAAHHQRAGLLCLLVGLALMTGCRTRTEETSSENYFTSGSDEADQRASQRMAKQRQLEGGGRKSRLKPRTQSANATVTVAATDEEKATLYARLGGASGLTAIVHDFLPRVLEDPRVNWRRMGVGGRFTSIFNRAPPTNWQPTPDQIARLEHHMIQFLGLATGGPADYSGVPIKSGHANMRITNAEFDAAVGDIKASLDNLQIPDREQKELLAVVESTRGIIVTER